MMITAWSLFFISYFLFILDNALFDAFRPCVVRSSIERQYRNHLFVSFFSNALTFDPKSFSPGVLISLSPNCYSTIHEAPNTLFIMFIVCFTKPDVRSLWPLLKKHVWTVFVIFCSFVLTCFSWNGSEKHKDSCKGLWNRWCSPGQACIKGLPVVNR